MGTNFHVPVSVPYWFKCKRYSITCSTRYHQKLFAVPVLEVLQLGVDLLDVEVGPQDVVVSSDAVDDRVVQSV